MKTKIALKSLIFTGGLLLTLYAPNTATAADITIECAYDTQCDVTPSRQAPLFAETEFPNYDLKPGDEVTRHLTVTNLRAEPCYFTLDEIVIKEDTKNFSEELLSEITDGIDTTGQVTFANLVLNAPIYLGELASTGQPGDSKIFDWVVTFDKDAGNEFQLARLVFDFDWTFQCGEEPGEPVLYIEKDNNSMGSVNAPGDPVTFFIYISSPDAPVFNVFVEDLPAGVFSYLGGSWTAHSNFRGDIKNSPTGEPTYSSPGRWYLGDMQVGEIVTLSYVGNSDPDMIPGLYKDIAWTWGTENSDPTSGLVVGNLDTGVFVGTYAEFAVEDSVEVEIEEEIEKVEEGEVLGIELPATGASTTWIKLILFLFALGIGLMITSKVLKKKTKNTGLILALLTSIIFGSKSANAASLMVRLSEPVTPSTYDSFNIDFVALDTEGNQVTIKCYKKAPSEMAFTQFGSDILLPAGGDSGNCGVTAGILDEEGIYKFLVKAQGSEPASDEIKVYYDSDGPGKPKYIEKEKISSCEYEVKFKTAGDGGETVRAEVYRSDANEKEFDANLDSKIKDFTLGSNEKATFNTTKPNCSDAYYYAVRAFDSAGNGSKVRGEEIKDYEYVTLPTEYKEDVILEEGIFPITTGVGDIEGEKVVDGEEPSDKIDLKEDGVTEEGEVLGEQVEDNWIAKLLKNPIFWVFAIILIALIRKKKKSDKQKYPE